MQIRQVLTFVKVTVLQFAQCGDHKTFYVHDKLSGRYLLFCVIYEVIWDI